MTRKSNTLAILFVLALTGIIVPQAARSHDAASEDWRTRIIDQREAEQEARIRAGRRLGELTWLETQKLRQEQRQIARMQREALADDGRIDRHEFRKINAAQNAGARHIREQRTDAQRPWWRKLAGF